MLACGGLIWFDHDTLKVQCVKLGLIYDFCIGNLHLILLCTSSSHPRSTMPNCTWPSSRPFWGTSTLVTPWCTPLRSCQSCRPPTLTPGSGWALSRLPGSGPSTLWGLQLGVWGPWCSTTWLDGKWAFWCQRCHRQSGGSEVQEKKHSASLALKSTSVLSHGYFSRHNKKMCLFPYCARSNNRGHVVATVTQWARPTS